MNTYEITFRDEVEAETDEQCYEQFLNYLRECVENEDVSAFVFVNLTELRKKTKKHLDFPAV
jgi:hypothetical protein